MELELLTQIQDKITRNRQRRQKTLRKLKNRNTAPSRVLASTISHSSGNSGRGRLLLSPVKRQTESHEQILNRIFAKGGWVVRRHVSDQNFRLPCLHGRTVAFTVRNNQGRLEEYSGTLNVFAKSASALFKLEGQEDVFNANMVGFMAVQPQ